MTYKLITSKNVTNIFDGKSDREMGEDECMSRGNKKIGKETEYEKNSALSKVEQSSVRRRGIEKKRNVHIARIARVEMPLMSIMFGKHDSF